MYLPSAMDKAIRKRKCGPHRNPRLGQWLWIIIQCSLCLPETIANCQGFDNLSITAHPPGMINQPYGEPVEFFCMDNNSRADNIEVLLGGKHVASEIVNSTTRKFYRKEHEKGLFTYMCMNIETKNRCAARVLVDSPPQNVSDFACKSKNLEELNCTWTAPEGPSVTNYSLTFILNGKAVEPCQASKLGKSIKNAKTINTYYCSWSHTSMPRYRQQLKMFFFNLKFSNIFGSGEQNFTVDHFSIVQPAPVENLRVIKNGTHSVLLEWNLPNNMIDLMPPGVVHKIEYQIAKIDNTSYFRSVDTSRLPGKNRTNKFLLDNLPHAHMQYEVKISIKPSIASDEFWSNHTYILFYTKGERPHRPPDTAVGAFDQSPYDGKRVIYVYWRQLEEYEEAGANFTYRVEINEDSKNPQTIFADSKKRSYVTLEPASLGPINIQIRSTNDNGSSINSSHLYIPPLKDTRTLTVTSFTNVAYENGTYKLSWRNNDFDHIDNYTLFWCPHNITKICNSRMNFTVVNATETEHVIELPKQNKYQFAISANKGNKTSGMVWASCDISKDAILLHGFPLKINHGVPGKSHVMITWTMDCTLREGTILGYHLTYCPVKDTRSNCADEKESLVNITDPKQMSINITGLKPFRTYVFSLSLNTTHGVKKIENASTGVTTTEDTPSEPKNVTISNIEYDSMTISWDPPLNKNGIIGQYVIYNFFQKVYEVNVPETDKNIMRRNMTLTGIQGFHNYSWSITACNIGIHSCSQHSPPRGLFVRSRLAPPSKLKSPSIKGDNIAWEMPERPGGPIDQYHIMLIKDDQTQGDIINVTSLSFSHTPCKSGVAVEKYQVRAVNFDEDINHGAISDENDVLLPVRKPNASLILAGEWSEPSIVACKGSDGLAMTFILMAVFALAGVMYGSTKYIKRRKNMANIKPVLPYGLGIPEKDESKYGFDVWNASSKDEKPPSDEMLLLPDSRGTTVSTNTKQKDDTNCGSSDHTDSTVLSDASRGRIDRQPSTSDDGSNSSLHMEIEAIKADTDHTPHDKPSNSDSEPSRENSPYFGNRELQLKPSNGYVQQPVVSPTSGYVQPAPAPPPPKNPPVQAATSSYVMAALSPPIFTTNVPPHSLQSNPSQSSGYVRPEDAHLTRSMHNFANPNVTPTKLLGPESLPIMPTLPPPAKPGADSSYIQLQSLDSLPSQKAVRSAPPAKASGYVSPADAVINKHLNNILAGPLAEESAMIDPTMSPDAYCRFSWSTDPANDNLHSLLADPPTIKPPQN